MVEKAIFVKNEDSILLKRAIAKLLSQSGYDQFKISSTLGLTQPMVSNYLKDNSVILDEIKKYAEQIVDDILKGQNPIFSTCVTFSKVSGENYIAGKNELINDEKRDMMKDLTYAFNLLKGMDVRKIIPEVKMNLALSKTKPIDNNDIACFQNGLVIIDDKISSIYGIQFGRSKHLASLLLYLKSIDEGVNSIMNIRYDESLKTGKYSLLTNDFKIKNKLTGDILLHKGDFGIEPMAYVIGHNATDVAKKVLKLI